MATTVSQFAQELHISPETLLRQLRAASIQVSDVNSVIEEADKRRLLDSLREQRASTRPRKITVTRRETTTIRQHDGQGGARTIEVEFRRRRVFVKNAASQQTDERARQIAAQRAELEAQAKAALEKQAAVKAAAEKVAAEQAALEKQAAEKAAAEKAAAERAAAEKVAAEKAAEIGRASCRERV